MPSLNEIEVDLGATYCTLFPINEMAFILNLQDKLYQHVIAGFLQT